MLERISEDEAEYGAFSQHPFPFEGEKVRYLTREMSGRALILLWNPSPLPSRSDVF